MREQPAYAAHQTSSIQREMSEKVARGKRVCAADRLVADTPLMPNSVRYGEWIRSSTSAWYNQQQHNQYGTI
jgi:hypothetical protein